MLRGFQLQNILLEFRLYLCSNMLMSREIWIKLLSDLRIGSLVADTDDFRSPFQRDIDRIIFSSAFRRLQDKTQVFPLARNDYVRTRLTHSLEVSSVGRSLGIYVGRELSNRYQLNIDANYFAEIIGAACLAHDIGNPPFGHAGEDTIRHWFLDPSRGSQFLRQLTPQQAAEFTHFEGNAQGFRVLTRLQRHTRDSNVTGGLQLTYASIGAFLKYPRPAVISDVDPNRRSQKKYNYFLTESDQFQMVMNTLGLNRTGQLSFIRHPLVFLMEAADDISYNIADMQDGFRLGLISYEEVFDFFRTLMAQEWENLQGEILGLSDPKDRVETLGGKVVGKLVREVAVLFLAEEKNILNGSFDKSLVDAIPSQKCMQEMSRFAYENIYSSEPVIEIKVGGFEVIQGLLDLFIPAIFEGHNRNHYDHKRLELVLRLVPKQFTEVIQERPVDPYVRLHQIMDFISGMTDSYALSLYRRLYGFNL